VGNLNTIGKNSVTLEITKDSSERIQDIALRSPRTIPPVNVLKAGHFSPELMAKGHELYNANCISCHGENGLGDGPSAALLDPKPRNFHSQNGWKNGSKVTEIYKTLEEGIPGTGMASYTYLPPEDRFALIHFIRAYAVNQSQDSASDLRQLDATYHLSEGMHVAGQIPIKKAVQVLIKEDDSEVAVIQAAEIKIASVNALGAEIFKRTTFNESRALASIFHIQKHSRSVDEFMKIISADPIQMGFKVNVILLSPNEWSEMHRYIFLLFNKEKER
jgi:mono/diheme cytochrome c family protein